MSVTEQEQTRASEKGDGVGRKALTAAAAAAATGAATYAVKKALSHDSDEKPNEGGEKPRGASGEQSVLASAASGGWEAARDALIPLAEDAADAAGRFLAERGPDFVKDRIVPRIIESFNSAKD